jgi:hypothetical protein
MKAKESIFSPSQRLDGKLFISLREKMLEKNPALMRFIVDCLTDRYKEVAAWDRSIDMAVTGLAILGAIDEGEEGSNYVRVTEESIASAGMDKSPLSLICEVARSDDDNIGAEFDEALSYVEGITRILNDFEGRTVIDAVEMTEESVIFFHAYWIEYKKMKGL